MSANPYAVLTDAQLTAEARRLRAALDAIEREQADRAVDLRADHTPTLDDIHADPAYWIGGPGRDRAREVRCPHSYRATSTCPNCDAER